MMSNVEKAMKAIVGLVFSVPLCLCGEKILIV